MLKNCFKNAFASRTRKMIMGMGSPTKGSVLLFIIALSLKTIVYVFFSFRFI